MNFNLNSAIKMLIIIAAVIIMALKGKLGGESFLSILGMISFPAILGAWWIRGWKKDKRKNGEESELEKQREKQINNTSWALAGRVFCGGALIAYYVLDRIGKEDAALAVGICTLVLYVIRILIGFYYDIKDRKR